MTSRKTHRGFIFTVTARELRDDVYRGGCTRCGQVIVGDIEPDVSGDTCPVCSRNSVAGTLALQMSGRLEVTR